MIHQITEFGHIVPHFSFFYLLLQSLQHNSLLFLYITLVTVVDYAFIGPCSKLIAQKINCDSPRPAFPNMNGMPSGHTQLMWMLFTFFLLQNDCFHANLFGTFALFMLYQRIKTGMHSPKQVFVGFLLGIFWGLIWYVFYNVIFSNYTNIVLA